MATNERVFYPIHAVGFAALGTPVNSTGYRAAKGVQSVSSNTNFVLEQVFQLGQLSLYENIEDIPDLDITVEKVVDGYALLEHLASPTASAAALSSRYDDNQCMMAIAYYPKTVSFATGNALNVVIMSGAYMSSINFNIPVQGSTTESISLVCNDKTWYSAPTGAAPFTALTRFTGNESPIDASGGVSRRENVNMTLSRWPTELPGIDSTGVNVATNGVYAAHIQNVTVNTSLGRSDLFELGSRSPYFRYAEFPTEVTTTIEITATEDGDNISVDSTAENLSNQTITIWLDQGVRINMGDSNKLQSVNTQGGDTGGGNVTVTYTYTNFNDLNVTFPAQDPAAIDHPAFP